MECPRDASGCGRGGGGRTLLTCRSGVLCFDTMIRLGHPGQCPSWEGHGPWVGTRNTQRRDLRVGAVSQETQKKNATRARRPQPPPSPQGVGARTEAGDEGHVEGGGEAPEGHPEEALALGRHQRPHLRGDGRCLQKKEFWKWVCMS